MEANPFWPLHQTKSSSSEEETFHLAARWSSSWKNHTCLVLSGPLGAGKTRFVAGILHGLGSPDPVASPTFPLVNTYSTPHGTVFHFDFYRLHSLHELEELAFDDHLHSGHLLAEWGEKFPSAFPQKTLQILITPTSHTHRTFLLQYLHPNEN